MTDPDQSWLPMMLGLAGLAVGAAAGWAVGAGDESGNQAALALGGGFILMVAAVVTTIGLQRRNQPEQRPAPKEPGLGGMVKGLLPSQRPSQARIPQGGLPTRDTANRQSEPTGRIEGGRVVDVVRRSGRWTRIHPPDGAQVWVETRLLEEAEAGAAEGEPG